MWRSALPVLLLVACAGKTDSGQASLTAQPGSDQVPAPAIESTVRPNKDLWRGRVVVAGHAAARFKFAIPAGLAPLRGVTPQTDPKAVIELAEQGPDGVGIADGSRNALNSIVVFSDPAGLGVVFDTLDDAARKKLAFRYVEALRGNVADAQAAQILQIGTHLALRIELPRVVMQGRPLRAGRHYLVFDKAATASIDCLWTDEEAARMTSACEAVVMSLERVPSAP